MAFEFNQRAAEQQQLSQYIGPILAGLAQGAPDCWPKINHAVNAIRVAATRAVTHAWNVVDQREATIHQLTTHINNQLLPRQYALQAQNERCRSGWQSAANEALTLRQQLAQANRTIAHLHAQLASDSRAFASARAAAERGDLRLRQETKRCNDTVAILRTGDTECQQKLTHCQQCGQRQTTG